jgi:membrane protein YqaA with SNARE-associated domain
LRSQIENHRTSILAELSIYAWMFTAALIAGTFLPFLPGSSELVLGGFLAAGQGQSWALVLSATAGNVIGAVINYFIGLLVSDLAGRRWFPATEMQIEHASERFNRCGVWILLLTWLPLIGDIITVVAGLLRTNFKIFLPLVTLGKLVRYFAIAVGFDWFAHWPE